MGNGCCESEKYDNTSDNPSGQTRKVINTSTPRQRSGRDSNPQRESQKNHKALMELGSPTQLSGSMSSVMIPKRGPDNYQSIKYLGKGTFGNVVLAEDKETGRQYAMKIINKNKIKEVNLMQSELIKKISQCELFVRIKQTFQNNINIYVVMDYLPKGDIYYYLKKKTCVFREDIIKSLVSQIICGIEVLHREGIIYRELKPENILVTNDGHIKLGDYGLSRMLTSQKNPISTFIGTLEYTAPQAIHGTYGQKADLWAIGILMYELKFQENLFEGDKNDTNQKVEKNIGSTNIEEILNNIIGKVSYDFRDVLIKLLQVDPEKRISLEDLKKHPFFQNVDWESVLQRKNSPPLKQILQSDHIKFKDPNNYTELAHRKKIENKQKHFETKLYQFTDQ